MDVGLRRNSASNRPQVEFCDGLITSLFNAKLLPGILDPNCVVGRRRRISSQVSIDSLLRYEFLVVNNFVSFDCGRWFKRLIRMRLEWKADLHAWARGVTIKHEEVVIVDVGDQWLCPKVLKLMVQRNLRIA